MYSASLELQSAENELANITISEDEITQSEYYALKASINQLRGRITVAEGFYLKALKQDNDNVKLLLNLGDLYKK